MKKYVKASSGVDVEIGDLIRIDYMDGEPQYTGKVGTVTDIQVDPWGDTAIYGTWGGCSLYPAAGDRFVVLRKGGR